MICRVSLAYAAVCLVAAGSAGAQSATNDFRVLATNKTSTMEKEMNEAADSGFRFGAVMGGETSFGGSEVVVVMSRTGAGAARYQYRLLATNRTSTMQKEMQEAGDAGFQYKGQTVFKSAFGGKEVAVILERDKEVPMAERFEYRLMATKRTSTMEKELMGAGEAGYELVGMTVADTLVGGTEVVAIMRRRLQ